MMTKKDSFGGGQVYSPYSSRWLWVNPEHTLRLGFYAAAEHVAEKDRRMVSGLGRLCDAVADHILLADIEQKCTVSERW